MGSSRYIGPYTLASQLEKRSISTVVIEFFTKKKDFFKYLENFLSDETVFVGISSTFLSPVESISRGRNRFEGTVNYRSNTLWFKDEQSWLDWSAELKSLVRQKSPKARVFIGGAKALHFLYKPELGKNIDYFSLGAGEANLFDTIESLLKGNEPAVVDYKTLKVLEKITLKNQLSFCPNTNFKKEWAIQVAETLPLEMSRGCKFNCKFCFYEKRNSVGRNIEDIIEEIKTNYDLFGTSVYNITDDCFNDSRAKVEKFCEAVMKLPFKIEWTSYVRFDVAVRFPETADLMVEAGASSVFWGVESLNYEAARQAGKGTHPDKIKSFLVDFKKKFGDRCFSYGSFITGLPGEDEKSFLENLNWVLENDCLHSAVFGPLTLSPYNEKLDSTLIDYADYSKNPEKYGFKTVSENLKDWEHETMNFETANELAGYAIQEFVIKKNTGLFSSAWQYGHFRTLGYSKAEIFSKFCTQEGKLDLGHEVARRNSDFMNCYWDDLLKYNL